MNLDAIFECLKKKKLKKCCSRNGQPLLTVSNHTSVMDDPGAMSLYVF